MTLDSNDHLRGYKKNITGHGVYQLLGLVLKIKVDDRKVGGYSAHLLIHFSTYSATLKDYLN